MEQFRVVTAIAAPLLRADINTDDIFPGPAASPIAKQPGGAAVLSDRSLMGRNAFAAHRWTGSGQSRPEFILNRRPYDRAGILVAGENFGCGSSREAAVWCLQAIGIRSIIAPSFGDIFYGNCFKNGVLPVRLATRHVEDLADLVARPEQATLTVDLERCLVIDSCGTQYAFDVGDYRRAALLEGLDEVAATLRKLQTIERHEKAYFTRRPWICTTDDPHEPADPEQ